jgi:hypothetical protein
MSNAMTRVVDGWSVTMDGDEPRILDEELGARLGFARPRKIREVIERMISDEILNDSDIRPVLGQNTGRRGRPATAYHLGETAAYLVCTRSNTKGAIGITRQIVEVFRAVRRGQLAAPQQVAVLSSAPLVGSSRPHRAELAAWCQMAARNNGVSVHRVHGELRRLLRVPGVYMVPLVLYPQARELVESLALGRLLLPTNAGRRLALAPADPAQRVLQFPTPSRPIGS